MGKSMLNRELFCGNEMHRRNNEAIIIGEKAMDGLLETSTKYGIVALPWWMAMDALESDDFYGGRGLAAANSHNRFSEQMPMQRHQEPIPLMLYSKNMDRMKTSLYWNQWLSIRQRPIDICIELS